MERNRRESTDLLQCFDFRNSKEGDETKSTKSPLQLALRDSVSLGSSGLVKILFSHLKLPAVSGSLTFLLQSVTYPEVKEISSYPIRDFSVVIMFLGTDVNQQSQSQQRQNLQRELKLVSVSYLKSLWESAMRTNEKMQGRATQDQPQTQIQRAP